MLDKVLITIIIIQSAITKSIFKIIQKTDHKIWRKTGKDSYIANKIWWLQQKWVGLDKRIRVMIIIQFLIAFISWRYFFWWELNHAGESAKNCEVVVERIASRHEFTRFNYFFRLQTVKALADMAGK